LADPAAAPAPFCPPALGGLSDDRHSGTTLIAGERAGRICHGVEHEPRYVDVAIERWSAMTGRSAILERTGASFEKLKAQQAGRVDDGQ